MKRLVGATALLLALAACGGSDSDSTTTTAASDATTTTTAGATPTTAADSTDTTAAEDTTTTTAAAERSPRARFAFTEVGLGPLGSVLIQNVGDAPGSLAGHWLCQRPSYHELPDVELQPGEVAHVFVTGHDEMFGTRSGAVAVEGIANTGPFDPESGEIGLYGSNDFGSADAIVSYVEWGSSDHGRSGTAVEAGIWAIGGFVVTTADSGAILATTIPPTDPSHWFGG